MNLKNQNKKALVTYITAGLESWVDALHSSCDSGADLLEVGLPFSDPIMDGPIIAKASYMSLENGSKTLDLIDQVAKANFYKPVAIMTYANVLYAHGVKEIVARIEDAGIKGLIIPDLTYEQSAMFTDELSNKDIALIPLVASTTEEERRKKIIDSAEGFLYCVAIKGITGQDVDIASSYTNFIEEISSQSTVPTYCGVGIRTESDAKEISALCDGVIVGTSIVEKMIDGSDPVNEVASLVSKFRKALD